MMQTICAERIVAYEENGNVVKIKTDKNILDGPAAAAQFLQEYLKNLPFERLAVVAFSASGEILGINTVSSGSTNRAAISLRNIFTFAFLTNASVIMMGHNHPGGIAMASDDDIDLTRRVKSLCGDLEVQFIDHIIISDGGGFYSMAQHGVI